MASRIWVVAMRDFNAVVRTKGFVIGLLFMPLLMMVSIGLPKLLARFGEQGERRFAVADWSGQLQVPLAAWAAARNAQPGQRLQIVLEPVDLAAKGLAGQPYAQARATLAAELADRARAGELFGWLLIGPRVAQVPPDLVASAVEGEASAATKDEFGLAYAALSLTVGELRQELRGAAREQLRKLRLESAGVDPALIARIDREVKFEEFVVPRDAATGKNAASGMVRSSGSKEVAFPIALVVLLLMGIMQSAGVLLNATIEEKSNRVIEVLVSSISAVDLLAGKLIGAFLTGMVVLLAWGAAAAFTAGHFDLLTAGSLSAANVAWYTYFFVGGFLLFGSVYVAIGAMCNSIQDAQNLMFPVVLLIMLPMLGMTHVLQHPDSAVSHALMLFPFSAPMIMPMRLAQSPPPQLWLVVTAAASVAVGVVVCLLAAGKIFRVAIFSSGKPPKLGDLWRWLREPS